MIENIKIKCCLCEKKHLLHTVIIEKREDQLVPINHSIYPLLGYFKCKKCGNFITILCSDEQNIHEINGGVLTKSFIKDPAFNTCFFEIIPNEDDSMDETPSKIENSDFHFCISVSGHPRRLLHFADGVHHGRDLRRYFL